MQSKYLGSPVATRQGFLVRDGDVHAGYPVSARSRRSPRTANPEQGLLPSTAEAPGPKVSRDPRRIAAELSDAAKPGRAEDAPEGSYCINPVRDHRHGPVDPRPGRASQAGRNCTMTVGAIAIGVGFLRSVDLWILRRRRIPVRDRPVSDYPTRPPTAPLSADAHGPTFPGSATKSPISEYPLQA